MFHCPNVVNSSNNLARWEARLAAPDGVHRKTKSDGMALIVPLFEQAQAVQDGGTVTDAQIDAVFDAWVTTAAP